MRADIGGVLLGVTITVLLVAWAWGRGVLGGRLISLSEPLNDDAKSEGPVGSLNEAAADAHTRGE